MYSHGRHLDELNIDVLREWQGKKIEESRTLDFKRDAYVLDSPKDKPRIDLASDACGFANAGGGLILLGVDEERIEGQQQSRFGEITGVSLGTAFALYQQQVDNIVRDAIEPRGVTFRLREIPTADASQPVVALGIERSPRIPHRLRAYGNTDFWIRKMRSVDRMDIDEVREAFRRSFTVLQDAERRMEEAEARTAKVPRGPEPFFWAAITPTFPTPFLYPPRDRRVRAILDNMSRLRPGMQGVPAIGTDVYGAFLLTGGPPGRNTPLFRIHPDGTLERIERLYTATADRSPTENSARFIVSAYLVQALAQTYQDFEEVRAALGITGPALLSAAVRGVARFEFEQLVAFGASPMQYRPPLGEESIFLRPRIETSDENLRRSFKDMADFFWNAWGFVECNGFDDQGFPSLVYGSWAGRL